MTTKHTQFGPNGDTSAERAYATDVRNTFVPIVPPIPECLRRDTNNKAPFMLDVRFGVPFTPVHPALPGKIDWSTEPAPNMWERAPEFSWPSPATNPPASPPCPLQKKHGDIICIDGTLWGLTYSECAPPDQRQALGDCEHCKRVSPAVSKRKYPADAYDSRGLLTREGWDKYENGVVSPATNPPASPPCWVPPWGSKS